MPTPTLEEFQRIINKLKTRKVICKDLITMKFIKHGAGKLQKELLVAWSQSILKIHKKVVGIIAVLHY